MSRKIVVIAFSFIVITSALMNVYSQQKIEKLRSRGNIPTLKVNWILDENQIGTELYALGDVNGDSLGDFGFFAKSDTGRFLTGYYFFLGGKPTPSRDPFFHYLPATSSHQPGLLRGDIFGTGRKAIILSSKTDEGMTVLDIFKVTDAGLDTVPIIITTFAGLGITFPMVSDINGDKIDDLIIGYNEYGKDYSTRLKANVYLGRKDFGENTTEKRLPDFIISDSGSLRTTGRLLIADLDSDGKKDVIMLGFYYDSDPDPNDGDDGDAKIKIYWGRGYDKEWEDTARYRSPDVTLYVRGFPRFDDFDNDGKTDMLLSYNDLRFYMSRSGKSMRNRIYDSADAERIILLGPNDSDEDGGYLNDRSSSHPGMKINAGKTYYFSGSEEGPDGAYDAISGIEFGGPALVGDVNGDGWDDWLCTSGWSRYGRRVVIFEGGDYIPIDFIVKGVEDFPVTGEKAEAFTVYPNPFKQEVTLCWKGNTNTRRGVLKVYNSGGIEIAEGEITERTLSLSWDSSNHPSGTYFLRLLDSQGRIIGEKKIIKE